MFRSDHGHGRDAVPALARSLSPSRVRSYLTCPRQYRYRYVDRLATVGPAPEPLLLGTLLHRAAAAYLSERPATEENALAGLARALTDGVEGCHDAPATVQTQLAALVLELHRRRVEVVVEGTDCASEVALRGRLGPIAVYARADVLWHLDGEIVHDEYKLSAPEPALLQIATACARLGLRALPDVGRVPIRHRLIVFRPTFSVRVLAFDEPLYRLALRRLWDVAAQVGAERTWAPLPGPDACRSCEYTAVCDAAARCVDEAPF